MSVEWCWFRIGISGPETKHDKAKIFCNLPSTYSASEFLCEASRKPFCNVFTILGFPPVHYREIGVCKKPFEDVQYSEPEGIV